MGLACSGPAVNSILAVPRPIRVRRKPIRWATGGAHPRASLLRTSLKTGYDESREFLGGGTPVHLTPRFE